MKNVLYGFAAVALLMCSGATSALKASDAVTLVSAEAVF